MNKEYIISQIENNIAMIEFYHPMMNSFSTDQFRKMVDVLKELGDNDDVKVIILKSAGEKVFSSGALFDELLTVDTLEKGENFFGAFGDFLITMKLCPKFIIGIITGKAVGGGLGIASVCDYVFATENSSVRLSEMSIGMGPFMIEPFVRQKIKLNDFTELMLQPNVWQSAQWAQEKGLYHEVYPDKESCEEKAAEFALRLKENDLEALKQCKNILLHANLKDLEKLMDERARISAHLVISDYTQQALKQFKEKSK